MARAGGITNAVNVGIAVQADWENREFISHISINVRKLFDFLVQFEATTKSKLATLNEKLDILERRLELLEIQVSTATANPALFNGKHEKEIAFCPYVLQLFSRASSSSLTMWAMHGLKAPLGTVHISSAKSLPPLIPGYVIFSTLKISYYEDECSSLLIPPKMVSVAACLGSGKNLGSEEFYNSKKLTCAVKKARSLPMMQRRQCSGMQRLLELLYLRLEKLHFAIAIVILQWLWQPVGGVLKMVLSVTAGYRREGIRSEPDAGDLSSWLQFMISELNPQQPFTPNNHPFSLTTTTQVYDNDLSFDSDLIAIPEAIQQEKMKLAEALLEKIGFLAVSQAGAMGKDIKDSRKCTTYPMTDLLVFGHASQSESHWHTRSAVS
ncbi:Protein BRICK1 [Capsicum annuum]|nr:Protein BRICK1 [Capsicum annuum]